MFYPEKDDDDDGDATLFVETQLNKMHLVVDEADFSVSKLFLLKFGEDRLGNFGENLNLR